MTRIPLKVQNLKEMLIEMRAEDDGSNYLEHIEILTSDEYNKFLGVNKAIYEGTLLDHLDDYTYTLKYNNIEYWSESMFKNKDAYDEALSNWVMVLSYLSTVSTDWIEKYLPQG